MTGLLLIFACGKKQSVKAVIFERKELPQRRLLIRYRYSVAGKVYADSSTTSNKILPLDSITVFINSQNPSRALPDFGQ